MTIDLSELSQERRAFLKANPDLLGSLEAEIPKQVQRIHTQELKENKGKAKWRAWQREVEAPILDPALREINDKIMKTAIKTTQLICPNCGEGDKGNAMNGTPWCFKCNTVLMDTRKVHKLMKDYHIRLLPKGHLGETTWRK